MRFFRCKCGSRTAWSSMGVQTCEVCEECGSTLAESPDTHLEPTEHQWKTQFNQDTGKPEHERCRVCGATRHLPEGPKIVCLCGSSRFVDIMAVCGWLIERDELAIAMGLHLVPMWYTSPSGELPQDHLAEYEGCAQEMDALHLRKIDLADEIFVVDYKGYIGQSTAKEIAHAQAGGKLVRRYSLDPIGQKVDNIVRIALQKEHPHGEEADRIEGP